MPHGDIFRDAVFLSGKHRSRRGYLLAADMNPGADFVHVGDLKRIETAELIVGYSFNLKTNELQPQKVPNPGNGRQHLFRAWRLKGDKSDTVLLRAIDLGKIKLDAGDEDEEE